MSQAPTPDSNPAALLPPDLARQLQVATLVIVGVDLGYFAPPEGQLPPCIPVQISIIYCCILLARIASLVYALGFTLLASVHFSAITKKLPYMVIRHPPDGKFSHFLARNPVSRVTSTSSVQFRGPGHASPEHSVEIIQYPIPDCQTAVIIFNCGHGLLVSSGTTTLLFFL
ncbi:hypothetical protein B0H12DRAFT_1077594 [Mycena haematopus]|nr:hypothetical protein B0H12DRAFT_1077594 [Mycena haematopus]